MFFCLFYLLLVHFQGVFKDNKLLGSHKTGEIKVFLNFFAYWSGLVQIITDSVGGAKTLRIHSGALAMQILQATGTEEQFFARGVLLCTPDLLIFFLSDHELVFPPDSSLPVFFFF